MESERIVVFHAAAVWLPLTENWIYGTLKNLPEWVENHVICTRKENTDQFGVPNVHALTDAGRARDFMERALRKAGLRMYLKHSLEAAVRHGGMLLQSHHGPEGWKNIGLAKRAGMRHVARFYGEDMSSMPRADKRWIGRYHRLFETADRVLCEGSKMREDIIALGCPAEKATVHHLGVDTERIPFRVREWNGEGPMRVMMAATFKERKGFVPALEALGSISKDVKFQVTIIGDANSQADSLMEKKKMAETILRHGMKDRVRMLGFQPRDVFFEELYKNHIFVSPSVTTSDGQTEGGAPVAIIEAAASGMMVASTFHADIPEVVRNEETGLLAPERDVEGLAKNLRWFAENPGEWKKMAEAGRKHIEKEYEAVRQGERLGGIYRDVTGIGR